MKCKKYILGVALGLVSVGLTSCDDLFRDAPLNKTSEVDVLSNPLYLDKYVNSWYRGMGSGFKTNVSDYALIKYMAQLYLPWLGDQLSVGRPDYYNGAYGDVLKGSPVAITSLVQYNWPGYMTQIQSINTLLEREGEIPAGEQKERVLGEAHFMRAYYYYMFLQRHGGIMIFDRTFNPLHQVETFPRASYQQMVDFIVKEAEMAAEKLPQTYDQLNKGRATKGAALMLKAKTYFWASSKVYQNKPETQNYLGFTSDQEMNMLAKAKAAYEELFALNAYSLIPIAATTQDGIRDEYRKIFLTKNSQESIFEIQHADDGNYSEKNGHTLDRVAAAPFFTGTTAAYTPTHNHVLEYGRRDGQPLDANDPYTNLDYRFYANVLYDGAMFRGHEMDLHYTNNEAGVDLKAYGTSTTAGFTKTGYYMAKFMDERNEINVDATKASNQNYIIWRLAEAILDYAEVLYRTGDVGGAQVQVNKIRERVHMPLYTALTWDELMNERRVEMAFEETTYWDFFRLGIAEKKLNGASNPLKGIRIDVTNGVKTYKVQNINRYPARIRKFDPIQYYQPIPWAEVKYHGVEQNPGWTEI